MPQIFKTLELDLTENKSPISHFSWSSSQQLEELVKSKYLHFEIKSLFPKKFSYPYHFHRNAEELFVILEGEATLRTPDGYRTLSKGDIVFFEEGPDGCHQIYNHSDVSFIYIDLRTRANVDVCEYPDSKKINILPSLDIFEKQSRIPYYKGEEKVRDAWPQDILDK